ncbi:hypothetical protein MMYC01_202995 [Madurella mycetomatis]|uniref:Uncharacterized protein n=1 Tax=Madurella mycetomatis TaxID=100816 RepID=A0A175WE35_9PEZI|nr:hypothetical protein MMYC01_202995 [Madurella mycetomatis]
MKVGGPLATLVLSAAAGLCSAAGFTNSFGAITSGSGIQLTWDDVAAEHFPLCITAQLIERSGEDGYGANAYRVNITTTASGTSYLWTSVPYPLRWIPSGLYQLELRPSSSTGEDTPLLAKSPFFSISESGTVGDSSGEDPPQPTLVGYGSEVASGVSKPLAIGLGVAIGIPSIVGLAVVSWCFRKRQRRAAMEKRKLKRSEFIID